MNIELNNKSMRKMENKSFRFTLIKRFYRQTKYTNIQFKDQQAKNVKASVGPLLCNFFSSHLTFGEAHATP